MAKKILLLFYCWFAALFAFGQDIITRTDGVTIKAHVVEIKPNQLNFRFFGQPDTLLYQISTQDVQTLKLADGSVKSFSDAVINKGNVTAFNYETDTGRNIFWYYPFDFVYSNFTLAYERILASGKIGFRLPLVFGLANNSEFRNYDSYNAFRRHNRFGVGLDVNFYPFGQGRFQYYLGPGIQVRSFKSSYYIYDGNNMAELRQQNAIMYLVGLKNGIYYQINKSFILSGDVGLGLRFLKEAEYQNYYRQTRVALLGNFHLGFRF